VLPKLPHAVCKPEKSAKTPAPNPNFAMIVTSLGMDLDLDLVEIALAELSYQKTPTLWAAMGSQ
jgi:hypothetical protein